MIRYYDKIHSIINNALINTNNTPKSVHSSDFKLNNNHSFLKIGNS